MNKDVEVLIDAVTEALDQIKSYHSSRTVSVHLDDIYVLADDVLSAARLLMDRIIEYGKQA